MNTRIGPAKAASIRKVITTLRDLVQTLPTQQEMREMDEALEALVAYLRQVQRELKTIPLKDEYDEASATIDRLDSLLRQAEENPVVGKAIGLEKPRIRKPHQSPVVSSTLNAREALTALEAMTIDQVRDALTLESKYSLSDLKEIAASLGIPAQSRSSRESLANKITIRIANSRGYRNLSTTAPLDHQ